MFQSSSIILSILLASFLSSVTYALQRATVFGSTGGVGQLICRKLIDDGFYNVQAISRDIESAKKFELLKGCEFKYADARIPSSLDSVLEYSDVVIISIGTTAFPTQKWKDGNNPKAACIDTVVNICDAMDNLKVKPSKVVLISSIGVERRKEPPFSILNSFGILDAKIDSENILIERLERLNAKCIVIRPGRLVGEPFTNFDLAKLLKLDQGDKKGIAIDTRDVLSGDMERADVAETLSRLLRSQISERVARFSIINTPGPAPSESQWGKLLSLFTVSQSDMLTTRKSNE